VQGSHFQRATDILCDVSFNSVIPELELIKEKKVIAEELYMYQDTPEENIYDEFHEQIYQEHPLAHNILGNVESLNSISRNDILKFTENYYTGNNMVFAVVGNVAFNRVIYCLEKYCNQHLTEGPDKRKKSKGIKYQPLSVARETDYVQGYTMLGVPAYEHANPKKWPLLLLNNLLGGPGLNSRLNLAIREKYGFTYHVESGYQAYSDSGLFHCYLSSDKTHLQRSTDLVLKELKKLRENTLGSLQMSRAKNQFMGQMVMADEARSGLMVHIGKGILNEGSALSLDEVVQKIKAIKAIDLLDVANEIFKEDQFSYLTYLPE
jgi:predicted Zn-dependent peptidase